MFGTYRLILAVLVALSHIGITIGHLNPGVIAVVGFYLISGYVMTGLLRTHYDRIDKVGHFYLDRFLRLFPHYAVVAALTFVWFVWTGTRTDYLKITPGIVDVFSNLLIVPQNYYMFNNATDFSLIPPSWSLGAEIQFYLVVPFIVLFNLRGLALALSAAVYTGAAFGLLHTDWFGYRLLPGVLFMFLLGSWLFDLHRPSTPRHHAARLVWGVIASVCTLGAILAYRHQLHIPYNRETLLGLALGLLALDRLSRCARKDLDEALGNLSYGVFLNHFFVKWMFFGGAVSSAGSVIAYLALSLGIAFGIYSMVEKPAHGFRKQLRGYKAGFAFKADAANPLT